MVFSALAFEAYLNFVGVKLAPDFWANERKHFQRSGLFGRMEKVLELCNIKADTKSEPYLTIWKLKELRDTISHGKLVSINVEREHDHNEFPDFTGYDPLWDFVTPKNAHLYSDRVEELASLIHAAAAALVRDDWFLVAGLGHNTSHRRHVVGPASSS